MSNYATSTNFLSKDALISGNPLKLVKGADLTVEFNNIVTAIATKIDGTLVFAPDGNAAQPPYGFTNNAGTGMFNTAGVLGFATSNTSRVTISTAGNVSVANPASGVAFTAVGFSTTQAIQSTTNNAVFSASGGSNLVLNNISATGQTPLDWFTAGTLSGRIRNDFNGTLNYVSTSSGSHLFFVGGDSGVGTQALSIASGGLQIGAPTGGAKGAGTINATGLFINNVAVTTSGSVVSSIAGTANQIAASASTGAVTLSLPQNVILPTPASGLTLSVGNGVSNSALTVGSSAFAWGTSSQTAVDIGAAAAIRGDTGTTVAIGSNQYFNGAAWVYKTTAAAAEYSISTGSHAWTSTVSGTAGATFSPTVQMNLSTAGLWMQGATGNGQGTGTINATGLFVNGVAVSALKVIKAALTARASNTVLSNDPDLVLAIPGAGTYAVEVLLSAYNTSAATVGISLNLNYSGSFTTNSSLFSTNGQIVAGNIITATVTTSLASGNCGTTLGSGLILVKAILVSTGAGNLGFAWAQVNTNATATNVGAGSYMTATKIA